MKKRQFWETFILVPAFFLACRAYASDLVVYSALDLETSEEIIETFKRQTHLDIELALQMEQAGTVASRIREEATDPQADILMGGNSNIHTSLGSGGLLQKYRSNMVDEAMIDPKYMDPNGYWSGWYLGAICILYNKKRFNEEIAPRGITPPSSWDDLLEPAYHGNVVLPNPLTTGIGVIIMAVQIFRSGDTDAGFHFMARLNRNVRLYSRDSVGPIELISKGEAILGSAWGHDAIARKKQEDLPIKIVFPIDDGYEIGAASIIKGCKHLAAAEKFIDFLLTRAPAEINARTGFRYPVRKGVLLPAGLPPFEEIRFVTYNHGLVAKNVESWKKRWAKIAGY
jgi:iron(III) transport system substrate-binding protein